MNIHEGKDLSCISLFTEFQGSTVEVKITSQEETLGEHG